MPTTYLDHAASAVPAPEALDALCTAAERWANPSSIHSEGIEARKSLERARAAVAALAGGESSGVVFTSGATEANNLAVFGVLDPLVRAGARIHAVATGLEHPSILKPLEALAERGLEMTLVAPGPDGHVRADDVLAAVRPETRLVSVIAASNELGTIQPVAEIARGLAKRQDRPLLHADAVQSVVSEDFFPLRAGADLATLSAHKIGGVKGAGALALRRGLALAPMLFGGGQERGLRSGTENVPGIMAFAAAAERLLKNRAADISRYRSLRGAAISRLKDIGVKPLFRHEASAPHILTVEMPGQDNDWIVLMLSRAGVMASAGSACKSGQRQASPVLSALGFDEARARSVFRISFGPDTNEEDLDRLIEALRTIPRR